MNARAALWLAWSLGGLSVAMFAASIVLGFLVLLAGGAPSEVVGGTVFFVPFLAFPVVGALVASKRPGNA